MDHYLWRLNFNHENFQKLLSSVTIFCLFADSRSLDDQKQLLLKSTVMLKIPLFVETGALVTFEVCSAIFSVVFEKLSAAWKPTSAELLSNCVTDSFGCLSWSNEFETWISVWFSVTPKINYHKPNQYRFAIIPLESRNTKFNSGQFWPKRFGLKSYLGRVIFSLFISSNVSISD